MTDVVSLRGDKQCPHGHTARRKCNDCTHEDDQREIARLHGTVRYMVQQLTAIIGDKEGSPAEAYARSAVKLYERLTREWDDTRALYVDSMAERDRLRAENERLTRENTELKWDGALNEANEKIECLRRAPFKCIYCGKDSRESRSVSEMTILDQACCAEHLQHHVARLKDDLDRAIANEALRGGK